MDQTLKWLDDNKFVAMIRSSSAEDAEEMIKSALAGGFKTFEISMQTTQVIRLLETYSKKEGCLFGVGAVTDGEMAQRAIKAGAKFISSHYTDRDVISVAKNNDVFVIQGVLTPTEAVNAYQLGADMIMLYPADHSGGPAFAKAIRGALPYLKLAANGGVNLENAFEYLRHCVCVFLGRSIFDKALVRANNWTEIAEKAKQFTQKLEPAKLPR